MRGEFEDRGSAAQKEHLPARRDGMFVRDDGVILRIVQGFRERVLAAPRLSVQPTSDWTDRDYGAAAEKKLRGCRRLLYELESVGGSLENARVLEVGAGAGIDSVLLALHGARRVVGIDLDLSLLEQSERGAQDRRLTSAVLAKLGMRGMEDTLRRLPVELVRMDATQLGFRDASFDLVVSRSALEHVVPIEQALSEMARVVRPGGLLGHGIGQFYWLRGCHKGGLVDLPWAHARLTAAEYRRFVAQTEGEEAAEKRSRQLAGRNRLGLRGWRERLEASGFEIVDWEETPHELALALLDEHPDVRETTLAGVTESDLVHSSIMVWTRVRATGGAPAARPGPTRGPGPASTR